MPNRLQRGVSGTIVQPGSSLRPQTISSGQYAAVGHIIFCEGCLPGAMLVYLPRISTVPHTVVVCHGLHLHIILAAFSYSIVAMWRALASCRHTSLQSVLSMGRRAVHHKWGRCQSCFTYLFGLLYDCTTGDIYSKITDVYNL